MSNQAWLKKFLNWNPEQGRKEIIRTKRKCNSFEKKDNGYCKHYMGCKALVSNSCARECDLRDEENRGVLINN